MKISFSFLACITVFLNIAWVADVPAKMETGSGSIEGKLLWNDGSGPVVQGTVKLVDKLKFYLAHNHEKQVVEVFKISSVANVREIQVDEEGNFSFTDIPPGTYYLFWRVPKSKMGNEWAYKYSSNTFSLTGAMPKPEKVEVQTGQTTNTFNTYISHKE